MESEFCDAIYLFRISCSFDNEKKFVDNDLMRANGFLSQKIDLQDGQQILL